MKRTLIILSLGIAGLWLTNPAIAADSGTYFHFDVGPNVLQKVHQEFSDGFERDLDFNTGVRIGISQGYNLNSWAALEFETGFTFNELKHSDDWLGNVPILANAIFRYDCPSGWTPFVGVGGGGSVAIAKTALFHNDSDYYLVAAWQGQAGLRYRMRESLELGLVYKYFGTTAPKFELFGDSFKLEKIHNHYVGLQLQYNF
jgi:opacity protein-like surface antigen